MPTTIFIAPGTSQCRVYAMPYPMKPGQKPSDLDWKYQQQWKEIARLNHRLELVYVNENYRHLADDIAGQMGGTYFEVPDVPG